MLKKFRLLAVLTSICMVSQYGCVMAEDYSDNVGTIELSSGIVTGSGISVEDNMIKIVEGGDFLVTGEAEDMMIYINTDSKVKLRLSGMRLTNNSGPAIFFEKVEKGFITVTENTDNFISDGSEYSVEAKAAIFSNDDLEIKGGGTLTVTGYYKHAIAGDDDVKIENAILNLTAKTDGIHVNNTFKMTGGTLYITAGSDGIQAEQDVLIDGGSIHVLKSEEGIESGTTLTINGGEINIVSSDDGLNSGGGTGGESGMWNGNGRNMMSPEGMQGGKNGFISSEVTQDDKSGFSPSKETQGRKGKVASLEGVQSSDGGIVLPEEGQMRGAKESRPSEIGSGANEIMPQEGTMPQNSTMPQEGKMSPGVTMPQKGMNVPPEMPRGENNIKGNSNSAEEQNTTDKTLYINGGVITIQAQGDGVDSNGNIVMTGGELYINGPTGNGNGAIDANQFIMTGGTVMAVGSSGMAVGLSGQSTQNGLKINLDIPQAAGTSLILKNAEGDTLIAFTAAKEFSSVVYSSERLAVGETYSLYGNDTLLQTIEMTTAQTSVGNAVRGGFGGGMERIGNGRPNQNQSARKRIKVYLNGEQLNFDTDPVMTYDTTLVPFRSIFEALGMEVTWDAETSTVTAQKEGIVIMLQIGNKTAQVNSDKVEIATAPLLQNERALVPVRFIAESLQYGVTWDDESNSVMIAE